MTRTVSSAAMQMEMRSLRRASPGAYSVIAGLDREFRAPLSEIDQGYMHRILERSDCFQGRVANREQVQIQIDFPQHQQWVEIFKAGGKKGYGCGGRAMQTMPR